MKEDLELKRKVQREYEQGYNHIRGLRETKRDVINKLLPKDIPEGQVRINLLWKNQQLERALFVSDKLNIKAITNDSVIAKGIMETAEKVFRYDDEDMDLIYMREDIVDNNGLYGVAITVVDNYDEEEQQPITGSIHPLSVIPDPKNWRGSKMRFIGFERRLNLDYIKTAPGFINQKMIIDTDTSTELKLNDEMYSSSNGTVNITEQEGLIDVYDHYTTYKDKKILTTWANNRELLIRYIELEPLTNAEKLTPSKIKFPVQIHRRKNMPGSFFGVSIADEIMQYQDMVSTLTNLQLIQARLVGLGPDKYVDNNLGIDVSVLGERLPGGRIIPVENINGPVQNSIYTDQHPNPSQFPLQMIQILEGYSKQTTGAGDVAFGDTPQGQQTKAEIQTLMANSNQLLGSVADNYLRGQKEFRAEMYRSYALNMGKDDKKVISFYQKGNALSLEVKKEEFIADGKVQIVIESQNQIDKENEKNSVKLLALQGVYLPYIQGNYARNEFLRKIGNSQGIKDFDAETYIELSPDEIRAREMLELLNRDEEVPPPQAGEDFRTYLSIYSQALNTQAKFKAIFAYREAILIQNQLMGQQAQMGGSQQASNTAMNMLNTQQQAGQTPTLSDIQM